MRIVFTTVLLLTASCHASAAEPDVLDCEGPFGPKLTHAALVAKHGAKNVVFQTVPAAEGTQEQATVLYPADPARRVEIFWRDGKARRDPGGIRIDGESRWRLRTGNIGIGSTLQDVETANDGAFTLLGFGWDYGGTVVDWHAGRLSADRSGCQILLRLEPVAPSGTAGGDSSGEDLSGDRPFSSRSKAMRAASPRVYEISLSWD